MSTTDSSIRNVDIVVIGGGPAGVEAACEAARSRVSVVLVSEEAIGGRSIHSSLIPSKVLIHLAHQRAFTGKSIETPSISRSIQAVVQAESRRLTSRLEDARVSVIRGRAFFTAPDLLRVDGPSPCILRFERAIIATGSLPVFPPSLFGPMERPDGVHILAPRFIPSLESVPHSLVVIGGGVTGAETASAFADLGSRVRWIVGEAGILPRFDRDLVEVLRRSLHRRGVEIIENENAVEIGCHPDSQGDKVEVKLANGERILGEKAFVAIGRVPDTKNLGLENAHIERHPNGAIVVDDQCRSSNPRVFAVGDAAGPPFTANKAMAEAWVAARAATGRPHQPLRRSSLIEAVYSRPEIAQVGLTPRQAFTKGIDFEVRRNPLQLSPRQLIEHLGEVTNIEGEVAIVVDHQGQILGATAVGERAADILAPIATGIHLGAHLKDLESLFLAEPTLSAFAFALLR
ncbi:MAG: NAD(P)/FAD-dependent oxidoreductase [Deltaproteobacteria bacterium]|nr:NAD(P)/FAD-dependent oxidoreductase [Deltaproteobacteria bacterium]